MEGSKAEYHGHQEFKAIEIKGKSGGGGRSPRLESSGGLPRSLDYRHVRIPDLARSKSIDDLIVRH
jgi:hypothetical protein